MPRNSSGNYQSPASSWNPAINGSLATAGDWNVLLADLSAALTDSLSRGGNGSMNANLNMGNNRITNLAAGTGTGDAATWQQLFGVGVMADIASAATVDIGAQNTSFLRMTGTTTITSFGTNYRGPRFITFEGAVTLTNSSTLVLPGGANITTAAGDSLIVIPGATAGTSDRWIVVAYQKAQNAFPVTSGTATVALTNVNVTLTTDQAAYPVITFTGTLTGNVNVIFPNDVKSYRILNNTTGAFTITCKTSAGTGVVVPAGSSDIFCNGTNIVSNAPPTTQVTSKIQPVTASVASNALTVTVNPTTLDFRSATLGSGVVNTRTIATVLSAVVPSGATLGTANATLSKVMILAIDNAGTVEVAVCNGSLALDESTLISTTALSADADSASVIYSTTARTNVPFRIVGFVESTQATAGTWATAPSKIQGVGGYPDIKGALNASGDAPIYACRAWVNFNGTGTVAIRASGNVSSITDNGIGDYTVNFTTAMPDVNYAAAGIVYRSVGTASNIGLSISTAVGAILNSSLRVVANTFDSGTTRVDCEAVCVTVFR